MAEVSEERPEGQKPKCIIVLGMAGTGKTTFVKVCMSFAWI